MAMLLIAQKLFKCMQKLKEEICIRMEIIMLMIGNKRQNKIEILSI